MTNTKIIFGGIVAIAAIIASPILAEAITGLDSTSITTTTEYNIEFTTNGPVATDGSDFGGFAIFTTGGDVIAVTSHKGVYDSEGQAYPNKNKTFDVCSNGNISEGYCDAAWHAHIVQPVEHPACAIAAVGSLTYEEPGSVNITGNVVSVDGVPIGTT
ncbi:MAG: hypothetical protein OEM28_13190 [Nitrosopumilus sp.]|nr:hypothetical protein [Nitrosopumilus sp.]